MGAAAAGIYGSGSGMTSLLRFRRPAARDPALAALSAARPAGSVAVGRNLIWGFHLRTALLYLDRDTPPARIVWSTAATGGNQKAPRLRHVVAASASSSPAEGSDSVGDVELSFAAKYPALVTGFFFMWYSILIAKLSS